MPLVQHNSTSASKATNCWQNICTVILKFGQKYLDLLKLRSSPLFSLQGKAFQWPVSSDRQTDSSASSSLQENEDSGRDSVDSRKVSQTRIPRVKFTCEGDSSPSPADSVSSVE